MPSLLRKLRGLTGLGPSRTQFRLPPFAWGRIVPGPMWLTMVRVRLDIGPVLVCPLHRMDLRSIVQIFLFVAEILRCAVDRFVVSSRLTLCLAYFVRVSPQLRVFRSVGTWARGTFSTFLRSYGKFRVLQYLSTAGLIRWFLLRSLLLPGYQWF